MLWRHTPSKDFVEYTESFFRIACDNRAEKVVEAIDSDQPERVANILRRDPGAGEGSNLVEKGVGVPDRPRCFAGYPEESLFFGLDSGFGGGLPQELKDDFNGDEPEIELLTAAFYGCGDFVWFGCRKNEDNIGRRFFDGLK